MRYTPVELRHVKLSRTMFGGYQRHEAEKLLEDIADSFEEVWRERGELADKLEDVEKVLAEVKQRESLLASTLVSAERAAVDAKEAAKREAELIVAEAHHEARSVTRSAQTERERLFAEARRVETLLRAALGMVEETRGELPATGEPQPEPEHWPKRQDTREFEAVDPPKLPPMQPLPEIADEDEGPWAGRDFAWG
ncbi:MAG: DivIVA domain-containing protein [Gaiellaceae bacterium]